MFFYRAWAGLNNLDLPEDPFNNQLYSQFQFHRWGYAALLLITLVISLCLNTSFALAFVGNPEIRTMPHWPLLCLCIRDLIVTVILIPTCVDWFVVNFGIWSGGQIWCQISGFLDFTLATMYPLLLICFAIILYSRRYGNFEDEGLDLPPIDEVDPLGGPNPRSIINQSGSRPQSQQSQRRPPSVVGSVDGYRDPGHPRVQQLQQNRHSMSKSPFYHAPNRPGSVTGSIEGRLASGRMMSNPRGHHASPRGQSQPQPYPPRPTSQHDRFKSNNASFMASSPIPEGLDEDLWEEASLDYPGRNLDSPSGWEFMEQAEVRYHHWHYWLLGLSCSLSLAFGIPAAIMIQYFPNIRPGCNIPVNPFSNPYSYTIDDAGFNFILSFVAICYIISSLILMALVGLICFHKMADNRFRTFVKMLTVLTAIFIVSRSPMDIVQLKSIIEAGMGFNLRDAMAIEGEIVLVWTVFIPLILNPVVYFSYLSEYRKGALWAVKKLCGCGSPAPRYKEEEEAAKTSKSDVSTTKETNFL